jgi:hypothetical protein
MVGFVRANTDNLSAEQIGSVRYIMAVCAGHTIAPAVITLHNHNVANGGFIERLHRTCPLTYQGLRSYFNVIVIDRGSTS